MHWAGWPLAWPLVLSLRMPSIYGGSAFGQVRLPHHRAMRRHSRAFACVPALPVLPCCRTLSTDGPGMFCTMWQRVRRATNPSRRTLRGSPATSSPSRMHTLSCRACARIAGTAGTHVHCALRRYAGEHQLLIPSDLKSCYFLMISAYVPRPIALVSSLSASGVGNVAPYRSWLSVTPTLAHIIAGNGPPACVTSLRLCLSLSRSVPAPPHQTHALTHSTRAHKTSPATAIAGALPMIPRPW